MSDAEDARRADAALRAAVAETRAKVDQLAALVVKAIREGRWEEAGFATAEAMVAHAMMCVASPVIQGEESA